MILLVAKGKTSYILPIAIQDSSSGVGAFLTGLTNSSVTCYYSRSDQGNNPATQVTLSGGTRGTYSSGGFVEKDSTHAKGVYELGIPNAALASGSDYCLITIQDAGSNNVAPVQYLIQLTNVDVSSTNFLPGGGTCTGTLTITDGLIVNRSSSNSSAVVFSGSGTGTGFVAQGGATGPGVQFIGGGTSGAGFIVSTTSGDAVQFTATVGNGFNISANGTSKHGMLITGGTGGTSDGLKLVAGSGGLDLRGSILDGTPIETGLNARQSLVMIAAATAGQVSGAGTPTVTIQGCNVPATTRIVASCDAIGDRTTLVLTIP